MRETTSRVMLSLTLTVAFVAGCGSTSGSSTPTTRSGSAASGSGASGSGASGSAASGSAASLVGGSGSNVVGAVPTGASTSAGVTPAGATTSPGAASVSPATPIGGSTPAGTTVASGYCALAAEMGRPPLFDDLLSATGSSNAVKVSASALRQAVTATTAQAPAEVSADYTTLGNSYDRYLSLLAKSGWNVGDLVQAIADPMSTTAVAYGKIDTAASDRAAVHITAYNQNNCTPKP